MQIRAAFCLLLLACGGSPAQTETPATYSFDQLPRLRFNQVALREGVPVHWFVDTDEDGAVVCDVIETLPLGEACADYPARVFMEVNEQGRQVCEVLQAVGGQAEGWRYDVSNPTCEQVAYVPFENAPPRGTQIDLACLVDVEAPVDGNPVGE